MVGLLEFPTWDWPPGGPLGWGSPDEWSGDMGFCETAAVEP